MNPTYLKIRERARQIAASLPLPAFYLDFPEEARLSRRCLNNNPTVSKLRRFVFENADNTLGHGFPHAEKVTLDAGTIMLVECGKIGKTTERADALLSTVQCAGLLHDIWRREKNHAACGAEKAGEILKDYALPEECTAAICLAIKNHEAFQPVIECPDRESTLLSSCLYDADKFRWGPDNFTHTVWKMVSFADIPLPAFLKKYPGAMQRLVEISKTFRTDTGKKYGPEFIDRGLEIGKQLMEFLNNDAKIK
jgi:hypothetical protein